MRVWVDANPSATAFVTESGKTGYYQLPMIPMETNNTAEYKAILNALAYAPDVTEIISDSQLVINQLNRKYHIKEEHLRKLALEVWELSQGKVKFTWVKRDDNLAGKMLK